jgi:multiple sugar transport system permease protein
MGVSQLEAVTPKPKQFDKLWQIGEWFDRTFHYWALAPALLVLLTLTVFPLVELLGMSVSTVSFTEGKVVWTPSGLDNFNTLLEDDIFHTAVGNTLLFVAVTVSVELVLGLVLALIVSQSTFMPGVSRAVLMIPILVLYNYQFGVVNGLIGFFNIPPQNWTGSSMLALPSVMFVDIWHWTAFVFLLMLAGIESLPIEPLEAARVDGASDLQMLRYILLPLLRPTILVTLMFRTIFAFKVFDEVFLLTSGGPGNATEVISLYINRVFFDQFRMGYGAMLSIVTILVVALIVIAYNRAARGRSEAV